jgi:four helix bundle protein
MQDADNARMKFEDLKAWQKAREMTNEIYRLGGLAPLNKDFGLRDQLRRAAVSVVANLAEGFERFHRAEKLQFWNVAKASAGEVKSLLYVVGDNSLGEKGAVERIQNLCSETSRLCSGLISSYSRSTADPES